MKKYEVSLEIPREVGSPLKGLNEVLRYLDDNCIFLSEQPATDISYRVRRYKIWGDAIAILTIYPGIDNENYDLHTQFFDSDKNAKNGVEIIAKDLGFLLPDSFEGSGIKIEKTE